MRDMSSDGLRNMADLGCCRAVMQRSGNLTRRSTPVSLRCSCTCAPPAGRNVNNVTRILMRQKSRGGARRGCRLRLRVTGRARGPFDLLAGHLGSHGIQGITGSSGPADQATARRGEHASHTPRDRGNLPVGTSDQTHRPMIPARYSRAPDIPVRVTGYHVRMFSFYFFPFVFFLFFSSSFLSFYVSFIFLSLVAVSFLLFFCFFFFFLLYFLFL